MPLKILLADDSMTAQKMAKEILTAAGYEVIAVSNGAVAAKKLADKPDIAIFDVFMPGYTGLELCEKVRASMDLAKTPVLLTVGKMEAYRAEDGQRVKADGVIIKPFEATDLLAAVKKLADRLILDARTKSGLYEKTMVFKSPQVIEEFKDDSHPDWKTEPEVGKTTRPMQMSSEVGSAPAFGADLMIEPSPAADPAFGSPTGISFGSLSVETNSTPAFEAAAPVSAAPAFEYPSSATSSGFGPPSATPEAAAFPPAMDENVAFAQRLLPSETPRRKRNTAEIAAGAAIAAAAANASEPEGSSAGAASMESLLEKTPEPSAPSADSAITRAPEIEFTGLQHADVEVEATPEPGLDSGAAGNSAIAQDPALETDLTKLATEFPTKFGTSEPEESLEADPSAASATDANDDFDAKVAAITSSYEDSGSFAISPEKVAANTATSEEAVAGKTPGYEDTQKIAAPVEAIEEVKSNEMHASDLHDSDLVEPMKAAFAAGPRSEEAEETSASYSEPSSATSRPVFAGPDLHLANALAAAVGGDADQSASEAPSATSEAPPHVGLETTSRAVTRVLERMLPSIMAEVAKEMEAAKKK